MPLDARTVRDNFLKAHARYEQHKARVDAKWQQSDIESVLFAIWDGMSEEERNLTRALNPEAFDRIDHLIKMQRGTNASVD